MLFLILFVVFELYLFLYILEALILFDLKSTIITRGRHIMIIW
jgi:hypothetical protein